MVDPDASPRGVAPSWGHRSPANGQVPFLAELSKSHAQASSIAELRRFHFGTAGSHIEAADGITPALMFPIPEAEDHPEDNPSEGTTTARLLDAAARQHIESRHADFREQLAALESQVRGVLDVERAKDRADREPDAMQRAIGSAARKHFDTAELNRVVGPRRGSTPMAEARRHRLEEALAVIDGYLATGSSPVLTLIYHEGFNQDLLPPQDGWATAASPDPCDQAAAVFDHEAEQLVEVFCAARIARLELNCSFDDERHSPSLEALDWQSLSRDEIQHVPTGRRGRNR